jgi:hypothetical protein
VNSSWLVSAASTAAWLQLGAARGRSRSGAGGALRGVHVGSCGAVQLGRELCGTSVAV